MARVQANALARLVPSLHDGAEVRRQAIMFGISERIKNAAAAGGMLALTGTIALVGFVWLTIAAYTLLCEVVTPAAAMGIVGGVAMLPCLFVLLRQWPHAKSEPETHTHTTVDPDATALVRLAQGASALAEKSPLLGAALTLGAAFLATRSPVTSALAVHMLAEAVERWTKSPPADVPTQTE